MELLISLGIFLIAMGAMFLLFQKGYQSFVFLQERQSVQGQVLRISSALESDFRVTHLGSVGVEQGQTTVAGETQSRDRISCLGLSSWQDSANFAAGSGLPLWDQHVVYRASTEASLDSDGRLERLVVRPESVPTGGLAVAPLGGLASLDEDVIVSRQALCQDVLSWDCQLDLAGQRVTQVLRLRRSGAQRGLDANSTQESFEARFSWLPKNTVPKL